MGWAEESWWAAGKERKRGETGPAWDLGWVSRAVWAEPCWVGFGKLGWVSSFLFLSLFFSISNQNQIYLNSNEFEFKLLYNQTKLFIQRAVCVCVTLPPTMLYILPLFMHENIQSR